MNRDAYIKANPARANDLEPETTHVVVDGGSRLAAAREAGLTHLNVLDEARALQRLLAIHGSQVELAKRLRKS
jgi:ParB family chromosome partitioning protein